MYRRVFDESHLVQQYVCEYLHDCIVAVLRARFGRCSRDLSERFREILDRKKLKKLNVLAATCANLRTFRDGLWSREYEWPRSRRAANLAGSPRRRRGITSDS